MNDTVKVGAIYRHFKGGLYMVKSVAIHTETGELLVIYMHLATLAHYARPIDMFISEVDHEKYPEVTQKHRFELVLQGE